MAPQKLFDAEGKNESRNSNPGRTALYLGVVLVMGLLGWTIYSLGKSNQPAVSASIPNVPAQTSAPAPAATPAPGETPKKVVHKRAAIVTYKDSDHGLSFRYPWQYGLKTGERAYLDWGSLGPVPMNFVQDGGVTLAAVELPTGYFPDTNLKSAFFNVSVNNKLNAEECGQFAMPTHLDNDDDSQPATPTKVKVGDTDFDTLEVYGEADDNQADAKYFHTFQNGACYEFALGVGTESIGDDDSVKQVNPDRVFHRLEKILATVHINSEPAPEVQASTSTTDAPAGPNPQP